MSSGLAIAAIVISILSAIGSGWVTFRVERSGFRVSESLLPDLATLLAALRSIATTGSLVSGELRTDPILINTELETIRGFISSTSGLALFLYATEVGSVDLSNEARAGGWRILRIHFVNLTALEMQNISDNVTAAKIAMKIELTLKFLDKQAIRRMRKRISNLEEVLSTIEYSQENDILLSALALAITPERENLESEPVHFERLQYLKDSGVSDPDIDMWLALEHGNDGVAELQGALDRGADPSLTLGEVLSRYGETDSSGA
jgi:hypothetical protein